MEIFRSEQYYIFVRNESSLWWHRLTGAFSVRSAWDMSDIEDIECIGITEGIIGKVEHTNVLEPRLMIIKESVPIGQLYFHHTIYKIKSVCFLNMGPVNQELELTVCTKHGSYLISKKGIAKGLFENSAFLNKTVGAVKNVSNTIKTTTVQAATQVKQTVKMQRVAPKVSERLEKRLVDELSKIFEDSDSFYYSRTLDLTNSLQRQYEIEKKIEEQEGKATTDIAKWWRHVDDRFFWNKFMLRDIISLGSPACDQWVLPVIQGYVSLSQIPVEADNNPLNTESLSSGTGCDDTFTLGLISRRSRYQAGTRYNRRGVEHGGKVANYVETEQIVSIVCADSIHRASFVQVRGSVPIFWSQPEMKFRPPPQLDRTEEESAEAFKAHFTEELAVYKRVVIVNLVEQQGRERVIFDAYSRHVRALDCPDLVYVTFDFHEYCRGMHYENVSILMNALSDIITDMRFCWRDDRGQICAQTGVFRINCIDCLDRTNVVQTAIAKLVLELQLCRLGLGSPGCGLPPALRRAFLAMWADNGDVVSRQYAGTKALKGDYTRTGERKITGMVKDGVASANRYYLSTFKDAVRQIAIDAMTGETRSVPEELITPEPPSHVKDSTIAPYKDSMAEHVKSLIDDCKKLVPDTEPVLGSWGLIDADPNTGDPQETEMDSVLLLTNEAYYVADYDETSDRVLSVQRVPLRDVVGLELGTLDTANTLFGVGRRSEPIHCIRISYVHNHESGYFHMFRSTSLRFFNNMAVVINNRDEMIESLHSICESIMVARDVAQLPPVPFHDSCKLDRRKSKTPPVRCGPGSGRSSLYLDLSRLPTLTKHVGEAQLVADIRNVGSKALSNMSEQFSKLNKFSHSLNARARPSLQLKFDQGASRTKKMFSIGQNKIERKKGSLSDGMSSDYSSDDENRTNIFEPTLDNFENIQHYIGKTQKTETENDCELIENPLYSSKIEPHESQEEKQQQQNATTITEKQTLKTPSNISKKNPFDCESKAPEIQINAFRQPTDDAFRQPSEDAFRQPSSSLLNSQKYSHSSSDVNREEDQIEASSSGVKFHVRSSSQHELALNIAQSHSESALKQLRDAASPVSSATRDMVLSPFSKFAKGVQTLGANLDPRKIKAPLAVKTITDQQYEDHRQLQEKWRDCSTRLIAL